MFITLKTGRDALYFQEDALSQLPWAYIWIAMASMPTAMLHLKVMSLWGPRRTRTGTFLVSAVILFALVPSLNPQNRLAVVTLFVVAPSMFAALFAGAWLLAGDLLEGATREELVWSYSRIGGASMLGGILGGLQAKMLVGAVSPAGLVAIGAAYLVLVAGVIAAAHRRYPRTDGDRVISSVGLFTMIIESRLVRHPYLQTLAGIAVLNALATLFIDFQFYGSAIKAGSNNAEFFANFYIVLNTAAFGLQLFVAPRIQSRLGVAGALLILPVSLLGLSGAFGFAGSFLGRSAVKIAEGGLKSAIHRSAWEQAFLPIETDCRGFGKIVVEGLSARLAEGLGAIILLVWMTFTAFDATDPDLTWITIGSIFFLLGWVILTRSMSRLDLECDSSDPSSPVISLPDT